MPQISVIVPVYKVEAYLRRCVNSILSQTFSDFELILVDDGSPDRCGEICDEYAEKDRRVVVIHKKNGGLSDARNAGLDWCFERSSSAWFLFVDSDDWIHPRMLEVLLTANDRNHTGIAISSFKVTMGEVAATDDAKLTASVEDVEEFFVEDNVTAVVAWGKLFSRECFRNLRFPVGKIHEDEFTTHRVLFQFPKISVVSAPMYYYFTNPKGIMQSVWSPRRLDGVEAMKEQVAFFKGTFPKAYVVACRKYQLSLIRACMECKANYPQLHSALKGELRKAFWKLHKVSGITIENSPDVYTELFPVFSFFYWRWYYLRKFLRERGAGFVFRKIAGKLLPGKG